MINLLRKYSLFLVIFIHAHIYLSSYLKTSVPYFYIDSYRGYFHPAAILAALSGYLLFKNYSRDQQNILFFVKDKYMRRIKAILIPYIFWITLFFLGSNTILYFLSGNKHLVFANTFHALNLSNYIKSFFYPEMAAAKHLWYLNNMLFAFAISPLLLIINKRKSLFSIFLIVIAAYYYFTYSNTTQEHLINYRFIMFFVIGSFFGMHADYLAYVFKNLFKIVGLCFSVFLLINLVLKKFPNSGLLYVFDDVLVTGLLFLTTILILKRLNIHKTFIYNRSNDFLLYIIHPILLSIICKILSYFLAFSTQNYIVLFLYAMMLSALVIKLNHFFYKFLDTYFSKFTMRFL